MSSQIEGRITSIQTFFTEDYPRFFDELMNIQIDATFLAQIRLGLNQILYDFQMCQAIHSRFQVVNAINLILAQEEDQDSEIKDALIRFRFELITHTNIEGHEIARAVAYLFSHPLFESVKTNLERHPMLQAIPCDGEELIDRLSQSESLFLTVPPEDLD